MVEIRIIDKDIDFQTVNKWWEERTGIPNVCSIMSNYGYIGEIDYNPVAALFFFPTVGCDVAVVGWPISDPNSTKEQRELILPKLFEAIHSDAANFGFKKLWTTTGLDHVAKRLESMGYVAGDRNITQYWRDLENG